MSRLARLLLLVLCIAAAPAGAETLRITSAVAADGAMPGTMPAQRVALPDHWSRTRPASDGPVWYRVGFDALPERDRDELLALYIAQVCTNLEVFLNGRLVASGGRMSEPLADNCNEPQLVPLPAALVNDGTNTVDIQVDGYRLAQVGSASRAGSLSQIELGTLAELAPKHALRRALTVTAPQAVGATLLLTGGFMFVLGFINRRESHLAYFGALAVGWATVDALPLLRALPLSNSVIEFLLSSMLAFLTLAGVQFLLRYAGKRDRRIDRLLPLQCVLMPLSLVVAGPSRLHAATGVWTWILAAEAIAAAASYVQTQRRAGGRGFWTMTALLAAIAGAGVIEIFAQRYGTRPLAAQLAQLATPVFFVLMGLRLVQQHGRALQEAELGKAHLEQRVREATAEIERNFRQLSELRIEQVTERERKRIAADLHDDLGAKLLTIVHTSESDRISTLAREALEEMRLSVRGLTGKPVRLADALGDWRAEVVNRLAQTGIDGEWSAPEDLPQTLSARAYVQTTRILREATSNIIKHSGATHCAIECRVAEGDFSLVIRDDGEGIPMELDGRLDRGHGMASMKQRAKQLQGQCLVESGPGYGTVIRLTLPLDRALESAPQLPTAGHH